VGDAAVAVRAADVGDAAAICAIYAPYVTNAVASFEATPPDAAEMARRMLVAPRLPWLLAERDGTPVGYAYASHHHTRAAYRWSVDTSVYLADSERRRGTGRALYESLLPELRGLGYAVACAGVTLPNPGSVGLHEALGFEPVGIYPRIGFKHGQWYDVGWWQLELTDRPTSPTEPEPWTPGRMHP
jgi:L-amino acid N-acyltransferase YncA